MVISECYKMSLSKNHKKCLYKIVIYYGFTEKEKTLLSQHEIEFLYRIIQNKKRMDAK